MQNLSIVLPFSGCLQLVYYERKKRRQNSPWSVLLNIATVVYNYKQQQVSLSSLIAFISLILHICVTGCIGVHTCCVGHDSPAVHSDHFLQPDTMAPNTKGAHAENHSPRPACCLGIQKRQDKALLKWCFAACRNDHKVTTLIQKYCRKASHSSDVEMLVVDCLCYDAATDTFWSK